MSTAADIVRKISTKALWHISPTESIMQQDELFILNSTLVQSLYSLISAGTEKLVATGFVPEKLHSIMSVPYMQGTLGLPVKYGYSLTGKIIESDVFDRGTLVHIMHPHQDMLCVDAKHCIKIPDEMPAKRAILVANMETVINAIWDADLQKGTSVLIAGYGTIGALLARICKTQFNCNVYILEKNETRVMYLEKHGYQQAIKNDLLYDVAFNCTSNESALQFCIDHVGEEGSVIELSWYGDKKVSLSLGETFHSMRKKIISSQVSSIPKAKRDSWNYENRKRLAFSYLTDDFFDGLITDEIPFEETPKFFEQLRNENLNGIGYCIKY